MFIFLSEWNSYIWPLIVTDTDDMRTVEIGLGNWEFTEITDGARNGELVVLSLDRAGVEPGAPAVRAAE